MTAVTSPSPRMPGGRSRPPRRRPQVPGWVAEPMVRVAWKALPGGPNRPAGNTVTVCDGEACQDLFVGSASAVMPMSSA